MQGKFASGYTKREAAKRFAGMMIQGGAAYAYGVSIVDGQVTWNDADIPQ